jgi:NAD(P)-dependent dehydrogenase (short-subunit alcohol dehydrogenase family)
MNTNSPTNKPNTEKQTLVITGGSSGIGLAICQRFVEAGYLVFNLDIQSSNVGHFIQVDVTTYYFDFNL